MSIKLQPCPFCGGKAHVLGHREVGIPSGDDGYKATVKCDNTSICGAKIEKWAAKKEWAVESVTNAWNRRADK